MHRARWIWATAVLLAMPGPAYGSVVSVTTTEEWDGEPVLEGRLEYTALVGEANRLRVERAADGGLLFTDTGVERVFEDEAGCESVAPQQVVCRPDPFEDVWELDIVLGDEPDTARVLSTDLNPDPGGGLPLVLDGGSGADVLLTRVSSVRMYGRAGADRIDALDPISRGRENQVSCGRGRDRARVDRTFYVAGRDCERLVRRRR
jgi:hypothetical protein